MTTSNGSSGAGGKHRPRLRPVETIVVPDKRHGKVIVLRDTQGVATGHAVIPPTLVPIVGRFTGEHTCAEIAREASRELGQTVPLDLVEKLARELDEALFLEGATFKRARAEIERQFAELAVRPASHAGGAYHDDPAELRAYVETSCIAKAGSNGTKGAPIVGLVAPHIDPWRGAVGYGHAYGALAARLPPDADTFILFGTSHAPMHEPFALCNKGFDTPFGVMEADNALVDDLAAAAKKAGFDPYADQFNHKKEHSLEFQAVFLKHLLGEKKAARARIVPILAGLGEQQSRGTDPDRDASVRGFLDAVRDVVAARPGRVVVIAGADLAHVGPRFGDPTPYDAAQRTALEATDRGSLARAADADAGAFWADVARDLDTRRVCGLAPIYSLLRALPEKTRGAELLHYEQNVDAEDGSIVSHAAVAFTL